MDSYCCGADVAALTFRNKSADLAGSFERLYEYRLAQPG